MTLDANRLAAAMERVTGQDADVSALWMPENLLRGGQMSQREFAKAVAREYDALPDIMVGPDGWMGDYVVADVEDAL
jgi:hypothetical protein